MLHGIDFRTVHMRPLTGRMAGYKGMALFPRRIGGRYVMLGRQDNENIWLLESDDLYRWDEGRPIMRPEYFWEFVQLGNCGSPIEIDEGWLVFTHGVAMVGPIRSAPACSTRTIRPSSSPARQGPAGPLRSVRGYVPNVVYSCGALVRGRDILLPYAVGDRCLNCLATGTVDSVLAAMVQCEVNELAHA